MLMYVKISGLDAVPYPISWPYYGELVCGKIYFAKDPYTIGRIYARPSSSESRSDELSFLHPS